MTPKPTNNGCEPFAQKFTRRAEKERWNLPATKYEPLNVLRDIGPGVTAARPGAFDHEQCGSLQADGSVKPYARPVCAPCWRQPQALQPSATRGKFSKD